MSAATTTSDRSHAGKASRCNCVCCDYDAACLEHAKRGGKGPLPDRAVYTARDLLDCTRFMRSGEPLQCSDEARAFWRRYRPHLRRWLHERVEAGLECAREAEMIRFGATSLLGTIEMRALGPLSDGSQRPPYRWEEIDAHEIFFDYLAHGGLMEGWDAKVVVEGVCSFADHLGRHEAMPSAIHERLQAEFELWVPRILDYFETGTWYDPE